MARDNLTLKDCSADRARMLIAEIGKVRCWLAGFSAGRGTPSGVSGLPGCIPGEDSLRQIQMFLQESLKS